MKIYIETFGCTANRADSLRIRQVLAAHGHTLLDSLDPADLVVVNTCTVTQTTQRKVLKFIKAVSETEKHIVVAGCLPAAQPETLKEIECQLITPGTLYNIAQIIEGEDNNFCDADVPVLEGTTGIVSISRGCVGKCSYCIVKLARGELISRSISEIVGEVRSLIQQRATEIRLTSQDAAAYGLDRGERLPELLDAVTDLEGDYMVRVGMMNPFTVLDIVDDVIDSFQNSHIFKFLHIPVQSGSDNVLKYMNRRHSVEDFKSIVQAFRNRYPEITLSTDFIVGYPTETEADFDNTVELLKELQPRKVNITRYSSRPHTPASLLYDMPHWKKKERSRILTTTHHSINQKLFHKKIGENILAFTTEPGTGNSTVGRDINYNYIVVNEKLPLGQWFHVKITESRTTYLTGKVLKKGNKPENKKI